MVGICLSTAVTFVILPDYGYISVPSYVSNPLTPIALGFGMFFNALLNEDAQLFVLVSLFYLMVGLSLSVYQVIRMRSEDWSHGNVSTAYEIIVPVDAPANPLQKASTVYGIEMAFLCVWCVMASILAFAEITLVSFTGILPHPIGLKGGSVVSTVTRNIAKQAGVQSSKTLRWTWYFTEFKYLLKRENRKSFFVSFCVILFAWIYVLICFAEGVQNLVVNFNKSTLTGFYTASPSSDFILALAVGSRIWLVAPFNFYEKKCNYRTAVHICILVTAILGYILFVYGEYQHMSTTGCFWSYACYEYNLSQHKLFTIPYGETPPHAYISVPYGNWFAANSTWFDNIVVAKLIVGSHFVTFLFYEGTYLGCTRCKNH